MLPEARAKACMVSPLLEEFKAKLQAMGRSTETVSQYARVVKRFLADTGKLGCRDIAELRVQDWETYLSQRSGLTNYAKHLYNAAFRSFLRRLGHPDWTKAPSTSPPKGKVVALKQDDVVKLLMAAEDKRDMTIIYMAYSTGLRRSEISDLNVADVDFGARSIHVKSGKGSKERVVFFDQTCEDFLRSYLTSRGPLSPLDPLFTSRNGGRLSSHRLGAIVRLTALKAGLITPGERYRVTLHKLRHTFATTMLDQVGIFGLKELLGHESIATTERYLHADMAYLKRAYEKGARALALRMENETGAVR